MSDLNADSRSPSVDLIDLHIFVVPIQSWLGKYSVAYNNVALQSTSAGFIRVNSHATLQVMRNIIAEQLEMDIVPEEYVFLRSVGRCMAIVNQSQEKTLKAKHFLPPVAFSPEIFILPGSHQWIASLRKDTKSIVVNGDIALQDEYRLRSNDFYSREATDEYPYSEHNSDNVVGSADQYAEKAEDLPHSNRRGREPLATMNGKPFEAENETDNRDPSEMLLEKANTKRSRQHFADVVKARRKKAERVGYVFQAENGYSEEEGEDELLNKKNANFGRGKDVDIVQSQNYKEDYQDELNTYRVSEKDIEKYNRQEKRNGRSPRDDLVEDISPRTIRSERDTSKAKDNAAEGRVIGQGSSRSDEDDRTDRQRKQPNDFTNEKVVGRDRSETFPRTKPAIQVLHPEVIHPTTPYAMSRATPIPSANVIHSTLTMDSYGRPSENKFLNNTTAQPSHELKSPPKSRSKLNAGTTHEKNAPAHEENGIAREEYVTAREENVTTRNDHVAEREDAIAREDVTAPEEIAIAPEEHSTQNADRLQINDRYARSERSSSQRSLNAEELKRREEEKRRLEEEKLKMDEKKKNLENDTMQMMKDMEELLRQKKEEEEKRKLEEEKRKQEEKERIEQKKTEASQLREQLIKVREERLKSQKEREGLMKNARELKAKLAAKRSVEPSIWEKKYLNEKERALKLEEELNLLKSELGASQKKLLKIFENNETDAPTESKSPRTIPGPSQLNNLKNEVRKVKKEKEGVENDIEKTKRKLAVESQHKTAAYQQLKELRNLKRQSLTAKVDKDQLTRTPLGNADVDSI